jgi:2-keto-3-deoxy-L-rhamnonate aldolase RhmA
MDIFPNISKRKMTAGDIAVGFGTSQSRPDTALIAKTCGFDWLFIDMEHGTFDVAAASQLSVSCLSAGLTPIVRVPGYEHHHSSRVLDTGAQGVIIPHVDTPAVARRIVQACRYPPLGHRSFSSKQPITAYDTVSPSVTQQINDEILIVVMLESPEAIENADAIAQVDGVDVLLIGTNDLSAEMGVLGQLGHSRIQDAYRTVIAACKKHGKIPGMAGVLDQKLMEIYIGMGAKFILGGSDVAFIMSGARDRLAFLRSVDHSRNR